MDGPRLIRSASALSILLLAPLRMTLAPLTVRAWLLIAASVFVVLLTVHLARFWRPRSRIHSALVIRLFLGCMGTIVPARVCSLAFATPCYITQHGLMLYESTAFMLVGLAFLVSVLFDCWRLAFLGFIPSRVASGDAADLPAAALVGVGRLAAAIRSRLPASGGR